MKRFILLQEDEEIEEDSFEVEDDEEYENEEWEEDWPENEDDEELGEEIE
ncbi:MAG: hypothetical protein KatS3mg095_0054 [Candidatus Parcubacteria bacterium]|nr:MAG: hypothetical protein KatS3mg095_0054 [Candidatus Parcubacteria bacterium]